MRKLLVYVSLLLLLLEPRLALAQQSATEQLLRWWSNGHYTVAWSSVQTDQHGGLLYIARAPNGITKLYHLRHSSSPRNRPQPLPMPYRVRLPDEFRLGDSTTAGRQVSLLTYDSTATPWHIKRFRWIRDTVTSEQATQVITPFNDKLLCWDECGRVAGREGEMQLVYYNNATPTVQIPLALPEPITEVKRFNRAGLTLLGIGPADASRSYAVYDCVRGLLTGFEYDKAEFLNPRLLKMHRRGSTSWQLLACPPNSPTKVVDGLQTILARDQREITALTDLSEAKELRAWRWRYAAIDPGHKLHWYDEGLNDTLLLANRLVDTFWWLPGRLGGIVHSRDTTNAGARWQQLEVGYKDQIADDNPSELRPITATWFLSRANLSSSYLLRRFDKVPKDTVWVPAFPSTSVWPMRLKKRFSSDSTDVVLLTWRDSTGGQPWNIWTVAANGPESQRPNAKARQRLAKPQPISIGIQKRQASGMIVVGRVLLTKGAGATVPTSAAWQVWLPCSPANQRPRISYAELVRQPFQLPGRPSHFYFDVAPNNLTLLKSNNLLEVTEKGQLRFFSGLTP